MVVFFSVFLYGSEAHRHVILDVEWDNDYAYGPILVNLG